MKKIISLLLTVVFIFSLVACNQKKKSSDDTKKESLATESKSNTNNTAKRVLKLGFNTVEDSVRGEMAKAFKEYVEKETNGNIVIEIYPSEMLGSEQEQIESVKLGAQDFTLPGGGAMQNVDTVFGTLTLPFYIKDYDHLHRIVDGEFGEEWKKVAETHGYKLLSIGDLGFAQITNNVRPITILQDMSGIKMRTPNEKVLIDTMKSLGASVTTLPFTEIYMALQQGVVDGQCNPLDAIYQTKFHEVQDYLAIVNIFCYNINFITSIKLWDELSEDERNIIQKGADKAAEISRKYYIKADEDYLNKMETGFKEITRPDTEEFKKAVQSVYEDFAKTIPEDFARKFVVVEP